MRPDHAAQLLDSMASGACRHGGSGHQAERSQHQPVFGIRNIHQPPLGDQHQVMHDRFATGVLANDEDEDDIPNTP